MDAQHSAPQGTGPGRERGLRYVRRLSNWTAVALVAATAVTAGYFARGSAAPAQPAAAVTGTPSQAAKPGQPCVTVPVAVSGGSGVTRQVPVRSCGPGGTGTQPIVIYRNSTERERGD